MSGLDAHTAQPLGAELHLAQSVADILSTPIGSRVMRREYGSDLPRLIDAPVGGETAIELYRATAEAIDRWEPRIRLRRVEIVEAGAGTVALRLTGDDGTLETRVRLSSEEAAA